MKKRMVRITGCLLAGALSIGSFGLNTYAAPVAGVSSVTAVEIAEGQTPAAGVSQALAQCLADSNDAAAQKAAEQAEQVSENDTPVVASEYTDIAIAQVDNYVNVRSEPNTDSEVLGKLYNNSAGTILETTDNGWYRIKSGNVDGYVKCEYVVPNDEELAKKVSTKYAKVNTTTLHVRTEPSTDASILTQVPVGDDLVVIDDESVEDWAKVTTEEGDGWVHKDYVDFNIEFVQAESKEEEKARLAKEEAERKAAEEAAKKAAEDLKRITGMDRIFFTNSGGEAVEGTLKAARKYAYKKGTGRYEFIAMKESFHGRSFGALSVTGHDPYRAPFEPLVPGVSFAEYNDLDSVKALVTDKTCAIILEPLQGEGGINLATEEFMKGIRKLCDEEGILMICDEVQCGMGRTGSMFTWQSYGIRPDIMSMAKAIGSGIPVGAFAMTEEIARYSLEPGDHGTTYGGNPLACTAVSKTIEIFEKKNLVAHVQELGAYLTEKLEELKSECDCVKAVKGKGLMQGIQVTKPLSEITKEALKEGLLIIGAGTDVIRMIPPLVIGKEQVDEMAEILKKALA